MSNESIIQIFEGVNVRIVWNEQEQEYYFAVADIALTQGRANLDRARVRLSGDEVKTQKMVIESSIAKLAVSRTICPQNRSVYKKAVSLQPNTFEQNHY